uniref:Heme O synthase n=1 Tax=Erythrolobus australicus TaxID=1077150 RepID=A0A7S1XHK9_9RHOD
MPRASTSWRQSGKAGGVSGADDASAAARAALRSSSRPLGAKAASSSFISGAAHSVSHPAIGLQRHPSAAHADANSALGAHSMRRRIRDALQLSKYKLSALVTFTAGIGYAAQCDVSRAEPLCVQRSERVNASLCGNAQSSAASSAPATCSTGCVRCSGMFVRAETLLKSALQEWKHALGLLAGTFLASASANTLNQMYEMSSDAKMSRTRIRPLPTGRVSLRAAAAFATLCGAAGFVILDASGGTACAALGLANIALYAGAYTPLKAMHPINTLVGAVVGAIPPLMGYTAAAHQDRLKHGVQSGGALHEFREMLRSPVAVLLGAWLLLWQIPHFHALAFMLRSDYAAGGIRMLAVSSPTLNAKISLGVCAAMLPLGAAAEYSGVCEQPFGLIATAMTGYMLHKAYRFARFPTVMANARALFRVSITYLPVVLTLLVLMRQLQPRLGTADHASTSLAQPRAVVSAPSRESSSAQGLLNPHTPRRREMTARRKDRPDIEIVYVMPEYTFWAPFPFLPLPVPPDAVYERKVVR